MSFTFPTPVYYPRRQLSHSRRAFICVCRETPAWKSASRFVTCVRTSRKVTINHIHRTPRKIGKRTCAVKSARNYFKEIININCTTNDLIRFLFKSNNCFGEKKKDRWFPKCGNRSRYPALVFFFLDTPDDALNFTFCGVKNKKSSPRVNRSIEIIRH